MNISELWLENADFVLRVVQRYVSSLSVAEDIRQEVFLKILNSGESFLEQSSLKTWLYSITYHCCIDYFREEKRQQQILDEYLITEPMVMNDSQSPVWSVNDIAEMPCPLSQLFVELFFGEGWSKEEIAQVFGYKIKYVCKKIQIGLRQLENVL